MKNKELSLSVQKACKADAPSRYQVSRWVQKTLSTVDAQYTVDAQCPPQISISVRFVGSEEGQRLNYQYRQKKNATNVLSFNYSDDNNLMGDIIICCPVVIAEAKKYNVPLQLRYAHLVVHGLLHLLGYQHYNQQDRLQMENLEEKILQFFNFPSPYYIQ